MFQGKTDHSDIAEALNGLKWDFYECAEVRFDWCGSNRHSFNRLFAVIENNGNSNITCVGTNKIYKMQKGAIYFLSCGEEYKFNFDRGTHFLSFHFNSFVGGCRDFFAGSKVFAVLENNEKWINDVKKLLKKEISPRLVPFLYLKLTEKIIEFMPEYDNQMHYLYQRDAKLHKFLLEHANGRTSISDLAEIAGMSADSLSRKFSSDYDQTLKKALNQAIASRAEKLLRNDSLHIKNIAEILKFNDEYYFSRFFKRETGKSPSAFREMIGIKYSK